jgi:hypothetical protein
MNEAEPILDYLKSRIPAYPFDARLDAEFVEELLVDFRDLDILEETKTFLVLPEPTSGLFEERPRRAPTMDRQRQGENEGRLKLRNRQPPSHLSRIPPQPTESGTHLLPTSTATAERAKTTTELRGTRQPWESLPGRASGAGGGGLRLGGLAFAGGSSQGGIGDEIEPAQRLLGGLATAAEVDRPPGVVGIVEDLYGLAGKAIGSLVEPAVEVDGSVACDLSVDLHAQPQLELLGGLSDQRLILEKAVERSHPAEPTVRGLVVFGFEPGPEDAVERGQVAQDLGRDVGQEALTDVPKERSILPARSHSNE